MFKDVQDCIRYLKIGIKEYPFLTEIIDNRDFDNWERNLIKSVDFNGFLVGESTRLNILNTIILAGYGTDKIIDDIPFTHCRILLNKLELYLKTFPCLILDKSFKNKIKNIEGLFFLSTLSELSLAYHFKKSGFNIKFETPFRELTSGKMKDVDISICDNFNNRFHLEVYMPNKQVNTNGFFDPHQDDNSIVQKIEHKFLDKFGKDEVIGLNGKILLAVNIAFLDSLRIKINIPFCNRESILEDLNIKIPSHINGILFFEDDFSYNSSFQFYKLLIR